jgi:flagellar biosynthesis chaperone FliJ
MLKNLKKLFIVEDDPSTKKEAPPKPQPEQPTISDNQPKPATETIEPSPGEVSDKFVEVLMGAMQKNNIEGFDYLEFKQSLQSLSKMPMDEPTRYKSAFAMASTMGASAQKLIETAGYYLTVLEREEKQFQDAVAQQRAKQIGNKEDQIQQLQNLVEEKAKQIQRLTQEIEQHQKQIEETQQTIKESTIKLESTRNDFVASYALIVGQIKEDVENMKQFLQ